MEKYPRGRRGSPAKGVVLDKGSPGSNPGFSAKISGQIVNSLSAFTILLNELITQIHNSTFATLAYLE